MLLISFRINFILIVKTQKKAQVTRKEKTTMKTKTRKWTTSPAQRDEGHQNYDYGVPHREKNAQQNKEIK